MPKHRVKRHAVIQPLDQPYRLIPLTQGQVAIVDAKDFEWLSQFNWHADWSDDTNSFYAATQVKGKTKIRMHRFILKCRSREKGDHKNHNTLDNRRKNLRKCTSTQNQRNRRPQKNNTSGFKGVSWDKYRKSWTVRIAIDGHYKYLGNFKIAKQGALAYDKTAKKYHGKFAYLNFP